MEKGSELLEDARDFWVTGYIGVFTEIYEAYSHDFCIFYIHVIFQ